MSGPAKVSACQPLSGPILTVGPLRMGGGEHVEAGMRTRPAGMDTVLQALALVLAHPAFLSFVTLGPSNPSCFLYRPGGIRQ
jgi:hypothetical protein